MNFQGDVALEAEEDFLLRLALGKATLHVQLEPVPSTPKVSMTPKLKAQSSSQA